MNDVISQPVNMPSMNIPAIIAAAGEHALTQYQQFFAGIADPYTRRSQRRYANLFLRWAERRELPLAGIRAFDVVFYIQESDPTISLSSLPAYLRVVGRLFDHLATSGVIAENPFDLAPADDRPPEDSMAAAEWQAVVDAAEAALTLDCLRREGLTGDIPPANERLCATILALGKARGIVPPADLAETLVTALIAPSPAAPPADPDPGAAMPPANPEAADTPEAGHDARG